MLVHYFDCEDVTHVVISDSKEAAIEDLIEKEEHYKIKPEERKLQLINDMRNTLNNAEHYTQTLEEFVLHLDNS